MNIPQRRRGDTLQRIVCGSKFALILLSLLTSIASAAQPSDGATKRVLLLSTGSRLSPGSTIVDQQILQALRTIKAVRIETT